MWLLLEQAHLVPTSVRAFSEMLTEDTSPDGPRLPSLTRLIPFDVTLTVLRAYHWRDILIKRVEQEVSLEVHACIAADRATRLVVVDVQESVDARQMAMEVFSKHGGIGDCDEVEYDDGQRTWYGSMDDGEGEDEGEYEAETYSSRRG